MNSIRFAGVTAGRSGGRMSWRRSAERSLLRGRRAVGLALHAKSTNTMFSIAGVCPPGPCKYGMAGYAGWMDKFGQAKTIPDGRDAFGKGNYWSSGYYSPTAQNLITAAELKPGLSNLYAAENYFTRQVASLWWPFTDPYILLVKKNLQGWTPLDPYMDQLPQFWYYVK